MANKLLSDKMYQTMTSKHQTSRAYHFKQNNNGTEDIECEITATLF